MKRKLYYFSPRTLGFEEARWAKSKLAGSTLVVAVVALVVFFEANQSFNDVVGLGLKRTKVLVAQNAILKDQLRILTGRLKSVETNIARLYDRSNELRLMVDLPKFDDDLREAGIGGVVEKTEIGVSGDIKDLLQSLKLSVGKAERELELQQKSYREVVEAFDQNSVKFIRMPAIKPMDGYMTSGFGMRRHPILGYVRMHEGIDISNASGTPVYATGDGVVRFSGRSGPGYGIMIEIDHGFGYSSLYGHLSKVRVREGQTVKRGDLIGDCGRTGLATNANLHYEIRLNGVLQNPIDFFLDGINTQHITDNFAAHD